MRTVISLVTLAFFASASVLTAQDTGTQSDRQPPPREGGVGDQTRDNGPADSAPLAAAQKAQVKAILSKYDSTVLTATQAKAIHEAFRQAGIPGGPAENEAVRAAGFDPEKLRDLDPPPGHTSGDDDRAPRPNSDQVQADGRQSDFHGTGPGNRYTIGQAISDRAQLSTIAFSGLAFLTGDFGAATFMPPGKVCDFFGFQYMRDIDAAGKGHNPAFLTRIAADVLHVLNDQQRQKFAELAAEQAPQFEQFALKRMVLIDAFQHEKDGAAPKGSEGLNREAVIRYAGDFYTFDAEMSYRRAEIFGQVVESLSAEQKATFAKMTFGDFNTWPDLDERDALRRPNPTSSKFFPVAYMTYASEFFSWYAGSIDADTYFCPERHGTYFGSFYMKDMPAMGKRNYDISTSVTGDSGEEFINLLTAEQRGNITSITERQRKLLAETVEVRRGISVELRKFLSGSKADKSIVRALGRRYGELDGEMSWIYATAFSKVARTLTPEQRAACVKLRNLPGYQSAPAYLYSNPMQKLPALPSSDFLFSPPAQSASAPLPLSPLAADGISHANGQNSDFSPSDNPSPDLQSDHPTQAPDNLSDNSSNFTPKRSGHFILTSNVVTNGLLPVEFTGDGAGVSPPLAWSGAPAGTKCFAIIMHHVDPQGVTKWYLTLYNIPADAHGLQKNSHGIGIFGNNSVNRDLAYAPPHSKGPGLKNYYITVYALSGPVQISLPPAEVGRSVLLNAMKDLILDSAELKVTYDRTPFIEQAENMPPPQN